MHVTEHLDRATDPLFSYEIIPPPRGRSARDILDIVEQLHPYQPPFIDVTNHSAQAYYRDLGDGTARRHVLKKRPGTISICGIIQSRYGIDTVPHLLCRGFTREETEDAMIELNYLGIDNVLAVRGDETGYQKSLDSGCTVNQHAHDLVKQLSALKRGEYLDEIADSEPIDMCLGVAGYPEKHVESPNMKTYIRHLKQKVDAGADYIVTQMFFDNRSFFRFERQCRDAGITVPIIPGLKVINNVRQLSKLPRTFHISIPDELVDEIEGSPKHVVEIGVGWTLKQCRELLGNGVPCIHFFVLNDVSSIIRIVGALSHSDHQTADGKTFLP